ncbi:MAG TPA: tetratricopeptide repeat protein [Pyrinomonadaceae bacterium]|jgi:tetratricopeptide (TPR) repeat protein|nr:tetratricopeptide repeat protein [Pyrinomonadaceae bacterium]
MRRRRFLIYCSGGLLIVLACLQGFGQSRSNASGNGGIHTIQGRIYLPNGRSIDEAVRVRLQSTNFTPMSVDTDRSGTFIFSSIAPGSYSIVVEAGEAFETAYEYVVIDPQVKIEGVPVVVLPKVVNVPVYLQFKKAVREAVGVYNAKMAVIPKEAMKRYENGLKLIQTGKNEEALAELRQAVALYPNFSFAYTEIGKLCQALGRMTEAESAFRSSLGIDSREYEAKIRLGYILLSKNEFPDAQKELEEAKSLNQSAAAPPYYLGLLYFRQRKFTDAKTEFELTEKLKGLKDYPLAHYYLGGIYWSEKQYKKAVDELEKYLQIDPNAKDAEQTRKAIQELRTKN